MAKGTQQAWTNHAAGSLLPPPSLNSSRYFNLEIDGLKSLYLSRSERDWAGDYADDLVRDFASDYVSKTVQVTLVQSLT